MCFGGGGGGPTVAEKQASVDAQLEADAVKQESIGEKAEEKRDDIVDALDSRGKKAGRGGGKGSGRRSLYSSGSAAGYLGRFD